jgi:hypothetical protein
VQTPADVPDSDSDSDSDSKSPLPPVGGSGGADAPAAGRSDPPANGKPRTRKREPDPADPRFVRFWQAYPRREKKPAALKAFAKIDPDAPTLAAMLAAIDRQSRSEAWTKDGGKYVPHPASWLNGRRWEDEVGPPAPTAEVRSLPTFDHAVAPPMAFPATGRPVGGAA